jgi:hypothetical protein
VDYPEYLLSYGKAGDFGRFRPVVPLTCRRGDHAVVRTERGTEMGVVIRQANEGHTRILDGKHVGQLLRLATPEDHERVNRWREREQLVFAASRAAAERLGLPLEILDVEIFLEGRKGVLYYLQWAESDPRPVLDLLANDFQILVTMQDLKLPQSLEEVDAPELEACGSGCGREGGGCGSCQSGGCSTCHSRSEHSPEPSPALATSRFGLGVLDA